MEEKTRRKTVTIFDDLDEIIQQTAEATRKQAQDTQETSMF